MFYLHIKSNVGSSLLRASAPVLHVYLRLRENTATPALTQVIETGQINKHFNMRKTFKTGAILWENSNVCTEFHTFSQKGYFSLTFLHPFKSRQKRTYLSLSELSGMYRNVCHKRIKGYLTTL